MKHFAGLFTLSLLVVCSAWAQQLPAPGTPEAPNDPRYVGEPVRDMRDMRGEVVRSSAVRRQFQRVFPCPATGRSTGPCPGWSVDHVIPPRLRQCR